MSRNSRLAKQSLGVVLLLLVSLSCNFSSLSKSVEPTPIIQLPVVETETMPEVTKAIPLEIESTSTVSQASIQDIDVDYVYTENLITSLYHLYGTVLSHFVDITITNRGSQPAEVVVMTELLGYSSQAIETIEVPAYNSLELHQDPLLNPEAIDRLASQKPAEFHIRAVYLEEGEERILVDNTHKIQLFARRDFVWIDGFTEQEEYELWAAWVTPTDPEVEALLRAAANYHPDGQIVSGYGGVQLDENGSVWQRLEAIWEAEANDYRLTYISTMTSFGPGAVQRIRLPAEVLEQSSGNCVELAMLFASAAEAVGLETAIVRIPGHAWVAIRTDLENAIYYFVETTMIGQSSFSEAVSRAKEEWDEAKPHFDAGEAGYAWVTIYIAREKGILPIPWR